MTGSASHAEPGVREGNSAGDERSIHKPNQSAESQSNGCGLRVVGFAGCDSVESSDVVNHLLVADRRGSFAPGLRLARKASLRSPGATACRQLRGSLYCELQRSYQNVFGTMAVAN